MKTIIAGSRTVQEYDAVSEAISESGIEVTEVVSGGADGVDSLGERWATEHDVPVTEFHPDWETYGGYAGLRRNEEMVEYADALIAVWDQQSSGTQHVIEEANDAGLELHVAIVGGTTLPDFGGESE